MKKTLSVLNIAAISLSTLASQGARATMTPDYPRGEEIIQIAVPGKKAEVCIIPKHFEGAKYSKKDLENERELCDLNVYSNVAVCPKDNSTNPGLNFFEVPEGMTIGQVEDKGCFVKNPEDPKDNLASKEAKYKLSISCSYTPSILSYYHMSRILGDIGNVPQAVLRTFDLERHIELGTQAVNTLDKGELIQQTWSGLLSHLKKGAESSKKDILFTDAFDQSYGALQKNPKKEEFYKEFFNGGGNNVARAANFKSKNPFYQMVTSQKAASEMVSRTFNQENVQTLRQMNDVTEFIILDTLLNQEDRFGNIHYEEKYYFFDPSDLNKDGQPKLKSESKLKKDKVEALKAVKVKEMLLKDNDCGVARTNIAKDAGLAKGLAHINAKVYHRILKLDQVADEDATRKFFRLGFLMTEADYTSVRKNLKELASDLKASCQAGKLKLDLNIDDHFSGKPLPAESCEI